MTDRTTIGDRMKMYETPSTSRRAFKGQPLVVRLDGNNFHNFCSDLKKPFDTNMSALMQATTSALVQRYNATVGYTQSDEITLVWITYPDGTLELPFSGKLQKIESLMASFAAAFFNTSLRQYLPNKDGDLACFDARAFTTPTVQEAYHAVLWRQQDCTKNAISMAAHALFPGQSGQKKLHGLSGAQKQELMFQEKGVNFNDYPAFFKRGTFFRREKVFVELDAAQLENIKPEFRPVGKVERTVIADRDIWLSKQDDPVTTLFFGGDIQKCSPPQ